MVAVTSNVTAHELAVTANHWEVATKETNGAARDERTTVGGLVQAGKSRVNDLITSAKLQKYKFLVRNLPLGDDFLASLKSSKFKKLNKFVAKFNRDKDLKSQISLVTPLTAKYGDDVVAKTLIELEKREFMTPELAKLVKQLRGEQLTDWLRNGNSIDDVFSLLKLSDDGYEAFRNGKLQVLEDFITLHNREKSVDEALLKAMITGFDGESNLVSLLAKAEANPLTKAKATELETALLTKWRNDNMPPLSVWSRLKLTDDLDEVLSSGKLNMFFKYMSENYPNSERSVLERLTAKYGEGSVAQALATAKESEITREVATKLQNQQIEVWLLSQKSTGDVFKLLNVKSDDVFTQSTKLGTLSEYISVLNIKRRHGEKTSLFAVVREGFGGDGDLARVVFRVLQEPNSFSVLNTAYAYRKMLFKRWMKEAKLDPNNAFEWLFNVKETAAGPLEKRIVARYTTYYNNKQGIGPLYTFKDPRRF
ncbi:hypothetical protein F442_21299 [Phytophthora nicotianae P10297]|uniref:RxLR effector protein n=3 Tax=Phytophthora nicotianae TaxID=4792 RepID=W2Y370_PHYNI|nr:hypothetical protein L915_20867 [Phytophthora nicotianae]ETL25394.1 hypothetical protein L916_20751 [Phytophthora nicotianae]ETP29565.1 hypothetical protein F442_21299 [Phytophthora nicotianae P10297]